MNDSFVHRFLSIAQFLIENNADLAAVNSDGDLAIDLADSERMRHLLEKHLIEQNIDCDEARQSEEKLMLQDAENWLRSDASEADKPHPRTGATALHVAAAKGYAKVLSLLLATRADVDKQDNDGWTPLHAAARWGQKEAAQMLVASLADMDMKNYAVSIDVDFDINIMNKIIDNIHNNGWLNILQGQTAIDVADPSVVKFLEELYKNYKRTTKRRPTSQIRYNISTESNAYQKRSTILIHNHIPFNCRMNENIYGSETPQKVIRVEVQSDIKNVDGKFSIRHRIQAQSNNIDNIFFELNAALYIHSDQSINKM